MVTPRKPPSRPLARAHHEMRELRNKIHDQDKLIASLHERLRKAEVDKAHAEHAARMARPSKPQIDALRVVCLISVFDAYRIGPGVVSAIRELARFLDDLQSPPPPPEPDSVMCSTAMPMPEGASVVPLPPEARRQQRRR